MDCNRSRPLERQSCSWRASLSTKQKGFYRRLFLVWPSWPEGVQAHEEPAGSLLIESSPVWSNSVMLSWSEQTAECGHYRELVSEAAGFPLLHWWMSCEINILITERGWTGLTSSDPWEDRPHHSPWGHIRGVTSGQELWDHSRSNAESTQAAIA